jgi:hypothetical protein
MLRRFDAALSQIGSAELKRMAHAWGGPGNLRKDESIAWIRKGLADPEKVKAVIAGLEPWERNALALVKRMGGEISYHALNVAVLASDIYPHRKSNYGYYRTGFLDGLLRKGLVLVANTYNPLYISDSFSQGGTLYADERLLAHIGFPQTRPLEISPIATPPKTQHRLPSSIVLDIIGILQAIEKNGGLSLTQAGEVRANDEKRCASC